MIIRYAGAALVVGACSLLGVYIGGGGKRRRVDLLELKKTLIILKSNLEYALQSLPCSFYLTGQRASQPFVDFYKKMAIELEEAKDDIECIWAKGVDGLKDSHLSKGDLEELHMLGSSLGQMDVTAQIKAIEMLTLSIDENLKTLHVENGKNQRMYRGIGIVSGLLITIVLL